MRLRQVFFIVVVLEVFSLVLYRHTENSYWSLLVWAVIHHKFQPMRAFGAGPGLLQLAHEPEQKVTGRTQKGKI